MRLVSASPFRFVLILSTIAPAMGAVRNKKEPLDEPLSAALFGKTRRRLFAWLFLHPADAFYIRQLARILGSSTGALTRELDELTVVGILVRSSKGRQVFYQVNRKSPIFEDLRAIILKTASPASRK